MFNRPSYENGPTLNFNKDELQPQPDIETIKNQGQQTPELCLAAVKYEGWNLAFVVDLTSEICLEAVKNCGDALRFVPGNLKTLELCLEAIKNDPFAIKWVPHDILNYYDLCCQAIKLNGYTLEEINCEKLSDLQYFALCIETFYNQKGSIKFINIKNITNKKIYENAVKCFASNNSF
jgi:hypothetical protein